MSLKKVLLEDINKDIVASIINLISSKLSLDIMDYSDQYNFVGKGRYAKVFSINDIPDKVIRIEDKPWESFFMDIEGDWNLKNVVKVYYSDIIDVNMGNKKMPIEITVMEKLEPIDEDLLRELGYIENRHGNIGDFIMNNNWEMMSDIDEKLHPILRDVERGIEELGGIYLNDLHSGNIMYDSKTNRYKIIDLSNT